MKSARLPFRFDAAALRAEVDRFAATDWVAHFNTGYYAGEWSAIALRAVDGNADQIYPDPTAGGRFADTSLLADSPYLRSVLDRFECELSSVRLLKLAAGARIREHRDYQLNLSSGEVRVHIPIVTHPDVEFVLDGEPLAMHPGEAWYLDLELPHRVDNRSAIDRIHLVIDCVVNDWIVSLLAIEPILAHSVPLVAAPALGPAEFHDPLTIEIVGFLNAIGLDMATGDVGDNTVVPGILVDRGTIVVDETELRYPGDLLHEAGHLAVTAASRRHDASGSVGADGGDELAAVAWSYAAARHLDLDPAIVFHDGGYQGGSDSLLDNFANGRYVGVPMLQWYGLCESEAYPAMRQWLRGDEPPGSGNKIDTDREPVAAKG